MNKIDTLMAELVREGKLALSEAIAIAAAVRWSEEKEKFELTYGTMAAETLTQLLRS
jgi:hypothetical protein